jgi:hypothetical protein
MLLNKGSRFLAAALAMTLGCGGEALESAKTPAPEAPPEGTLAVSEMGATLISGSYTVGDDTLQFEARELSPNLLTTTLKLHGLTLDSTLDTRGGNRMWSQDGFATATGADTAMSEEDQQLILFFVKALEKQYPDVAKGDGLSFHFSTVINYWAQWSPAMELRRIKFEDRERAIDMCWYASDTCGNWGSGSAPAGSCDYEWHTYDGHDCSTCSGDPVQGQGQNNCSSYGAYGDWDDRGTTWYWYGGSWHSAASGHGDGSYLEGDCFGRYGGGCGSGTAYFQENGSHDHCVRNGHVIVSAYCSDELASTTQPYNCY